MRSTFQHASDQQLELLLTEAEDGLETSNIVAHVETCEMCQSRLQYMVSVDSLQMEVQEFLSGHSNIEQMGDRFHVIESSRATCSESDSSLLDPPSHPEMLGRLGRYEIERRLGAGGMGIVFKGMDTELHRPVAIKVLAPYLSRNEASRQRFARESRAAAAVVHEHVVAIHNVESSGENPYLVMQYVSGESLQARVERLGPLTVEQILRIGIQACSGLAAAHEQGIVHRDVKPANILLEDSVERVLITDFGLARTVDDASLTHTGVIAGTPHYMSPEQANGNSVDHRSDLFSLGAVLYFVATGAPPFTADRAMGVLHCICSQPHRKLAIVNPKIPWELSDLVDRLLEKQPKHRFVDANSAREELARILQELQHGRLRFKSEARRLAQSYRPYAWTFAIGTLFASVVFTSVQSYLSIPAANVSSRSESPIYSGTIPRSDPSTLETWNISEGASPVDDSATSSNVVTEVQNDFRIQLSDLKNRVDQYEMKFEGSYFDSSDDPDDFIQKIRKLEKSIRTLDTFPTRFP